MVQQKFDRWQSKQSNMAVFSSVSDRHMIHYSFNCSVQPKTFIIKMYKIAILYQLLFKNTEGTAKLAAGQWSRWEKPNGVNFKNPLMCKGIQELLIQPELEGTGF